MKEMNRCWVCDEEILGFEEFFSEEIEGITYQIHDRPGCKEIWDEIKEKSKKCVVCGKKTLNLIFFGGNTFIVHSGYCTEILRKQLGLDNKPKSIGSESINIKEGKDA